MCDIRTAKVQLFFLKAIGDPSCVGVCLISVETFSAGCDPRMLTRTLLQIRWIVLFLKDIIWLSVDNISNTLQIPGSVKQDRNDDIAAFYMYVIQIVGGCLLSKYTWYHSLKQPKYWFKTSIISLDILKCSLS